MYLRYRLDEQGKRVYTFKVSITATPPLPNSLPVSVPRRGGQAHAERPPGPLLPRRPLPEGAHEVQGALQPPPHPEAGHAPLIANTP